MKHNHPVIAAVVLCWFLAINGVASETSNVETEVMTAPTAAELDLFVTGYYRNPQPELIARAIEAFGPSGFVEDRTRFMSASSPRCLRRILGEWLSGGRSSTGRTDRRETCSNKLGAWLSPEHCSQLKVTRSSSTTGTGARFSLPAVRSI